MKTNLTVAFAILAVTGAFAQPTATVTSTRQSWAAKPLTVNYTLADGEAIVTVDIQTNGVSIGAANQLSVSGDVNRVVQDGPRSFKWYPPAGWYGESPDPALQVGVKLTVWTKDAPPDYMVIDLDGSKNIEYFTSEDALPLGIGSDVYRTDKLVLRRVPAKGRSFRMGASGIYEFNNGNDNNQRIARRVAFTHDYYLGVFEVTQGQYAKVYANQHPSIFKRTDCRDTRPVEHVEYFDLLDASAWPNDDIEKAVADSNSKFFSNIRTKTGLDYHLALPTEAQWEFACRAGEPYARGVGMETPRVEDVESIVAEIARYSGNGGATPDTADNGNSTDNIIKESAEEYATWDTTKGTARVGSYRPNDWGLYDMFGNVAEMCHDFINYNSALPPSSVDPVGLAKDKNGNATYRVTRGGSCRQDATVMNAAFKGTQQCWLHSASEFVGFRVCYNLP